MPAAPPPDPANPTAPHAGETAGSPTVSGSHTLPAVHLTRTQRFHRWLRGWAAGPFAMPAMATLSFLDACISPILPEVIMVPMVMGQPQRRHMIALWASVASVVGGVVGYLLGMTLWDSGLDRLFFDYVPGFTPEVFASLSQDYGSNAFWVVFAAGFTPLPYKLATVTAGVCYAHVDFGTFVLASALSRPLRFWLEIELLHRLGLPMMKWLSRRAGTAFFIFLVAVLLAWWLWPEGEAG